MRRVEGARELLDGPLELAVLTANLRDLGRVNRWLGGTSLSWRAVKPFLASTKSRPLRLLDVGTGAADIPRGLLERGRRQGAALEIVATDVQPEIVDFAAKASQRATGLAIEISGADRLTVPDASFDVAHASLVIHHLDPVAARRLLAEMGRVATQAVILNDLDRGRLWLVGAWLLSRLATRNAYTRHDAPLSVRRAYVAHELIELARSVGLRHVRTYRARPPYRYALVFVRAGQ
jgi:ubiquinone/menaquinone biosynthesis C-methylase UbiE